MHASFGNYSASKYVSPMGNAVAAVGNTIGQGLMKLPEVVQQSKDWTAKNNQRAATDADNMAAYEMVRKAQGGETDLRPPKPGETNYNETVDAFVKGLHPMAYKAIANNLMDSQKAAAQGEQPTPSADIWQPQTEAGMNGMDWAKEMRTGKDGVQMTRTAALPSLQQYGADTQVRNEMQNENADAWAAIHTSNRPPQSREDIANQEVAAAMRNEQGALRANIRTPLDVVPQRQAAQPVDDQWRDFDPGAPLPEDHDPTLWKVGNSWGDDRGGDNAFTQANVAEQVKGLPKIPFDPDDPILHDAPPVTPTHPNAPPVAPTSTATSGVSALMPTTANASSAAPSASVFALPQEREKLKYQSKEKDLSRLNNSEAENDAQISTLRERAEFDRRLGRHGLVKKSEDAIKALQEDNARIRKERREIEAMEYVNAEKPDDWLGKYEAKKQIDAKYREPKKSSSGDRARSEALKREASDDKTIMADVENASKAITAADDKVKKLQQKKPRYDQIIKDISRLDKISESNRTPAQEAELKALLKEKDDLVSENGEITDAAIKEAINNRKRQKKTKYKAIQIAREHQTSGEHFNLWRKNNLGDWDVKERQWAKEGIISSASNKTTATPSQSAAPAQQTTTSVTPVADDPLKMSGEDIAAMVADAKKFPKLTASGLSDMFWKSYGIGWTDASDGDRVKVAIAIAKSRGLDGEKAKKFVRDMVPK